MRNDDETRLGRARHLVEQVAKALDVVIIKRSVDLIEHADRRRVGEEHGEDERKRGERLPAAREQRKRGRLLAGRTRDDFEPRLERVLVLDKLQLGGASTEQLREQAAEMLVHELKRGEQPLARLAVEVLDALTQPLDGFDEIIALGRERAVLGLHLAQLLLG